MEQRTEKIEKVVALDFANGDNFGPRYKIIEVIGQGGMGKVFKALDLELNENVALKMILPHLSSNPDVIARFKRELQFAREINHDHVIRIHDLGEINGIKFISMKYIDGQTLQDILKATGKLSIKRIIHIATQLCEALSAAHKKGVVHRDLKPQNIMLDRNGIVYILDFGIARSAEKTDITQNNIILGTPDFMSPEQIRGIKADVRTDIYALGIILYEMATGELPFSADTPAALLSKHMNEKPAPPKNLNKQIPPFLQEVILQCIEKKPEDRFQSVDDILRKLIAGNQDKSTSSLRQSGLFHILSDNGKPRRILKWALLFFLAFYLGITIISLITDMIYKNKLSEFEIEYRVFQENYFPVKKFFLPEEWETRDCNAWDTYSELFSLQKGNHSRLRHLGNRLDLIWKMQSRNAAAAFLKENSKWEKELRVNEISQAVNCTTLAPENYVQFYLPFYLMDTYTKYFILRIRMDFFNNELEVALKNIMTLGYFMNDILISSSGIDNFMKATDNFQRLCIDIIPAILAKDIALSSLEMEKIEKMIALILKNLSPETLCQQNYFSDINEMKAMVQYKKENSDVGYFLLYKIFFYKYLFSANKWIYELLDYNKKIKSGFEFISDPQKRLEYAFKLKKETPAKIFEMAPIHTYLRSLFIARTIGKLAIVLIKERSYSMNSLEFSNMRGTDFFINEMTGKPFEFELDANGNISLYLTDKDKIEFKKNDYNSNLNNNIQGLRNLLLHHFRSTEDYLAKKYSNQE